MARFPPRAEAVSWQPADLTRSDLPRRVVGSSPTGPLAGGRTRAAASSHGRDSGDPLAAVAGDSPCRGRDSHSPDARDPAWPADATTVPSVGHCRDPFDSGHLCREAPQLPSGELRSRLKIHGPLAAQFNGIVSGRRASGGGKAMALIDTPDTNLFISNNNEPVPLSIVKPPGGRARPDPLSPSCFRRFVLSRSSHRRRHRPVCRTRRARPAASPIGGAVAAENSEPTPTSVGTASYTDKTDFFSYKILVQLALTRSLRSRRAGARPCPPQSGLVLSSFFWPGYRDVNPWKMSGISKNKGPNAKNLSCKIPFIASDSFVVDTIGRINKG